MNFRIKCDFLPQCAQAGVVAVELYKSLKNCCQASDRSDKAIFISFLVLLIIDIYKRKSPKMSQFLVFGNQKLEKYAHFFTRIKCEAYDARCLKITEKISFNIASGHKFNKKCQKWTILRSNSAKIEKFKCDILSSFQTQCDGDCSP